MPAPHENHDSWDALGDCRWIWKIVLILEISNACDWATSALGVGMLGLPEHTSTVRWLISALGVIPGITVHKTSVGITFACIGWIITWACRKRIGRAIHVIGLMWVMGIATALMIQTVLWNLIAIAVTMAGYKQ